MIERTHTVSMGVELAERPEPERIDPNKLVVAVIINRNETVREVLISLFDANRSHRESCMASARGALMGIDRAYLNVERAENARIFEERLRVAADRILIMFELEAGK
jgi:hypothetical protein